MPVLDTSLLIDLERGSLHATRALDHLADTGEPLIVPAQVAIEYLSGLQDATQGLHRLDASFTVVPVRREHILEAARLAREARARGVFPGWADTQIAAAAILEDTFIVSADTAHFEALEVACWNHREDPPPGT